MAVNSAELLSDIYLKQKKMFEFISLILCSENNWK